MSTKIVTDPKTGRMETVEAVDKVTPEDLARSRRELRDMLDGNTQFLDDPYAGAPPAPPVVTTEGDATPYGWAEFTESLARFDATIAALDAAVKGDEE